MLSLVGEEHFQSATVSATMLAPEKMDQRRRVKKAREPKRGQRRDLSKGNSGTGLGSGCWGTVQSRRIWYRGRGLDLTPETESSWVWVDAGSESDS